MLGWEPFNRTTYPGYYGPLAFEGLGADFGTPDIAFSPDGQSLVIPGSESPQSGFRHV